MPNFTRAVTFELLQGERPLKRSDIQPEFLFILVDQKVYNLKSLENLVTVHVQDVHSYTRPYRISPGTRLAWGSPGRLKLLEWEF